VRDLTVRDAIRYVARSIPWQPAVAAWVAGALIVATRHDQTFAPTLELVSVLLATGAGFALDDPAAEILAASPASLLRRRGARVLFSVMSTVLVWLTLVGVQGPESANEAWAIAAMFAGLLALSLAIAGVASRRSASGRGGIVAGPALFVLLIASSIVPPRWRPLPMGDVPGGWAAIYLRWGSAAIVGAIAFVWSSRDRAAGTVRRAFASRPS
jgi:hypothetical protein